MIPNVASDFKHSFGTNDFFFLCHVSHSTPLDCVADHVKENDADDTEVVW